MSIVWLIMVQAYFAMQCKVSGIYSTPCHGVYAILLAYFDDIYKLDIILMLFSAEIFIFQKQTSRFCQNVKTFPFS